MAKPQKHAPSAALPAQMPPPAALYVPPAKSDSAFIVRWRSIVMGWNNFVGNLRIRLESLANHSNEQYEAYYSEFNNLRKRSAFYATVYSPDGFDPLRNTLNELPIDENTERGKQARAYINSWKTAVAVFLGLRTYLPEADLAKGQSWPNIARQSVGYKSSRGWWNLLTVPLFTLRTLITFLPTLLLNIASYFTEIFSHDFLMLSMSQFWAMTAFFTNSLNILITKSKRPDFIESLGLAVGIMLAIISITVAIPMTIGFAILYYLGRSFTSPIDAILGDWNFWQANEKSTLPKHLHLALRLAAVLVRVVVIAAIWAVIAIFAAPALTAIAPTVTTYLPFLTPVFAALQTVASASLPLLASIIPASISSVISATLVQGVIVGTVLAACASVRALVNDYVNRFSHWLHREEKQNNDEQPAPSAADSSKGWLPNLHNRLPRQRRENPAAAMILEFPGHQKWSDDAPSAYSASSSALLAQPAPVPTGSERQDLGRVRFDF